MVSKIDEMASATAESIAEAKEKKDSEAKAKQEASVLKRKLRQARPSFNVNAMLLQLRRQQLRLKLRRAQKIKSLVPTPKAIKSSWNQAKARFQAEGAGAKPTTRVRDTSDAGTGHEAHEDVQVHLMIKNPV